MRGTGASCLPNRSRFNWRDGHYLRNRKEEAGGEIYVLKRISVASHHGSPLRCPPRPPPCSRSRCWLRLSPPGVEHHCSTAVRGGLRPTEENKHEWEEGSK